MTLHVCRVFPALSEDGEIRTAENIHLIPFTAVARSQLGEIVVIKEEEISPSQRSSVNEKVLQRILMDQYQTCHIVFSF